MNNSLGSLLIIVCLVFAISASASVEGGSKYLYQDSESAQSLTVQALESALDFLAQNDNKNAIAQVKIAKKNLRKIPTLPSFQVKGMTARLDKAIKAIKGGNNNKAISEISHVHDELA